jgi:ABC-type uncharacterized transport system substrate-binding protein
MSPSEEELIVAANAALADPNFRASLRQMHAEGYPLIQIVEALGLNDEMNDRVRGILEALPDDVVAGIRTAVVAMLDSTDHTLPVVCTAGSDQPVSVSVAPENGKPTILVRPAKG